MVHFLPTRKTYMAGMRMMKAFFLAIIMWLFFIFGWMVGHQCRLPSGISAMLEVHPLGDKLGPHDRSILSMSAMTDERAQLIRQINDYEEGVHTNVNVEPYLGSNSTVRVFRFTDGHWARDRHTCTVDSERHMRMVTMKSASGKSTPIAIHYPKNDVYVSGNLALRGSWEWTLVNKVLSILRQHPRAHFIDIGSNIGEYSLNVALEGRSAIAVEPLHINNVRLCVSLMAGHLTSSVTIVSNALSDQRSPHVTMGKVRGNIGASWVVVNGSREHEVHNEKVASACLDDLLTLPDSPITEAVVKLDVETHEYNVLMGAELFFQKVKVWAVAMEWQAHRHLQTGAKIVDYFRDRGYEAIHPFSSEISLLDLHYSLWPSDVLWRRRR